MAETAITWKDTVAGYGQIGVSWEISSTDTSVTYKPIVYFWYLNQTQDPWINYSWDLKADGTRVSNGSKTVQDTSIHQGTFVFDGTYSNRSIQKGHSKKTLSLYLKFGDLFGGFGSGWTGDWENTWTYTVPALNSYTVSYNANGGTNQPSNQTKWFGETLTLSSTKPTRDGYTFMGWGTSASDTSVDYASGDDYTANAAITLYAIWKKTITLSYNANVGSGAPSSQSATIYNATTSYTFTIPSTKPTRTGYTFLGWSKSNTATSSSYSPNDSITLSNSDTLYAVWRTNVLTIKYNVNGGKITSDTYYVNNGLVYIISDSSVLEAKWNYNEAHENGLYNASTFGLKREGYKFIGWKVGSSGTTIFDQNDSSVVPTDLTSNIKTGDCTITLYAEWELSGVVYIDNGTTLEQYLVYIDNGSSWDLYLAYVDNGSSWDKISG